MQFLVHAPYHYFQGLFRDLSKQVPGTNSQIRWSVEPEPHLHSRPAVRGGEPGRESREDQVRCDERIRRQSKDSGQHCFPGGSSPQLKWMTEMTEMI